MSTIILKCTYNIGIVFIYHYYYFFNDAIPKIKNVKEQIVLNKIQLARNLFLKRGNKLVLIHEQFI